MTEELISQSFALAGTTDDPGDVHQFQDGRNDLRRGNVTGDPLQTRIRNTHDPFIRFDRAKGIVGTLSGLAGGQCIEQSTLADIGQSDNPGFHDVRAP